MNLSGFIQSFSHSILSTKQPAYSLLPASTVSGSYASISPTTTTPSTNILYNDTADFPSLLRIVPFSSVNNATTVGMRVVGWNPCSFPLTYTNLATYSEQLDNTGGGGVGWISSQVTITANNLTAPDGNLTAEKILETTGTGGKYVAKVAPAASPDTQIRTFSIYVKGGLGRQWAVIQNGSTSGTLFYAVTIDLDTGLITNESAFDSAGGFFAGYTPTYAVTNAGNGWWRVAIASRASTYHLVSPSNTATPGVGINFGAPSYTGEITKGIYAWGAQLEFGTTANPYLATAASTVTGTNEAVKITAWIPTVLADLTLTYSTGTVPAITVNNVSSYVFSNITQVALSPDASLYRPSTVTATATETASVLVDTVGSQLVQLQFKANSGNMGAAWYSI
jgi:hypothetical protein